MEDFADIESGANAGAFGAGTTALPSPEQCKAGNYKLGRVTLHGFRIAIEQPRNSYREGVGADGKAWRSRMAAHYGYIAGTRGADGDGIDVFVGPHPEAESVYVINQFVGGKFDEHKVMLAFASEEDARRAYLESYERGWNGLRSLVPVTVDQLKWWVKHGNAARPLVSSELPKEGAPKMSKTYWNGVEPFETTLDALLYQIRREDADDGLLLDRLAMADIIEDADGALALDALVTPLAKLERVAELMRQTMARYGNHQTKPLAVQVSEPFSKMGAAHVAVVFELSDGQTVSVFFHNPDVTPKKIMPADEMVSWKWMLNKKDITIVVAPERGKDLNVREVAARVMRLAAKNSDSFARANSKRAERMQRIESMKAEAGALEGELAGLQKRLEVAKIEKESRDAEAVRKIQGLQDKQNAVFERMEKAKSATPTDAASLKALMDDYDDLADEIRTARGEEAKGRSSWGTHVALHPEWRAEGFDPATPAEDAGHAAAVASLMNDPMGDMPETAYPAWEAPAEVVRALTDEQFKIIEGVLEEENAHPENVILMALRHGDGADIAEARELLNLQEAAGGLSGDLYERRKALYMRLAAVRDAGKETDADGESVEITGNELGEFAEGKEGFGAMSDAARQYYLDNLAGKIVANASIPADIEVRKSPLGKITGTKNPRIHLKLVPAILRLLKIGKVVKRAKPVDQTREPNIKQYVTLKAPVKIGGEAVSARLVVKLDDKGHYLYDQSVNKNALKGSAGVSNAVTALADDPALNQSAVQRLDDVGGSVNLDSAYQINQFDPGTKVVDREGRNFTVMRQEGLRVYVREQLNAWFHPNNLRLPSGEKPRAVSMDSIAHEFAAFDSLAEEDAVLDAVRGASPMVMNLFIEGVDIDAEGRPVGEMAIELGEDEDLSTEAGIARALQVAVARSVYEESVEYAENYPDSESWRAKEMAIADFNEQTAGSPRDMHAEIAKAIVGKDAKTLIKFFVHGMFEASEAVFERATGLKIRRLKMSAKEEALKGWAGWTDEQRTEYADAEAKAKEAKAAERAAAADEHDRKNLIAVLESRKYRTQAGDIVNARQLIDQKIAEGYVDLAEGKRGAAKKWTLWNRATGYGMAMKDKNEADYARMALAGLEGAAPAEGSGSQPAGADSAMQKKVATSAAMKELRGFMSNSQKSAVQFGLNGEEKAFFQDKMIELADIVRTMPKVYGQDGKGDQAIAYLHYFKGGMNWYITEKDSEAEQLQAFGLADLGQGFPEIGYINLVEVTQIGAELDFNWKPKTLAAIKAGRVGGDEDQEDDSAALQESFNTALAGNGGDYFEAAKDLFKNRLQGSVVKTAAGEVHIIGSTWREMKRGLAGDSIKAMVFPFIKQILSSGEYGGREALNKDRKDSFVAFHFFEKSNIDVGGGTVVDAGVTVAERENGELEFSLSAYGLGHSMEARWRKRKGAAPNPGQEPGDTTPDPAKPSLDSILDDSSLIVKTNWENLVVLRVSGKVSGAEPIAKTDLTYSQSDDMFTAFYPNTKAGEDAWKTIAQDTDGTGKVLNQHVGSVVQQLRDAGYTVEKMPAVSDNEVDALAAELATPDGWELAVGETFVGGVEAAVSAANDRGDGYEYAVGPDASVIRRAKAVGADNAKLAGQGNEDAAFLQSVIDGKEDINDPDIPGKLEAAFTAWQSDAEMFELAKRAINTYTEAMMAGAAVVRA